MSIEQKRIEISSVDKHLFPLPFPDIKDGQLAISNAFVTFFQEHGYTHVEPTGLLPEDDSSVLFTGATITPLKKYLMDGIPDPGLCLVQKCLRTKRLEQITDMTQIPDWTHYFTMCGILASSNSKSRIIADAHDLLINHFHINPQNLLIETCPTHADLSAYWDQQGIALSENTQSTESFRWNYGIPGIYGRGINFLLRFNDASAYRELGNFVSVENQDGAVIGYEFGFGLESFLSTIYGFKKPMEASLISAVIPYKEGLQEKFLDTLMAAVVIYRHGIEPGRGKEKHVLKKLVHGLSFLRRNMQINDAHIKKWAAAFERIEFGDSCIGEKLLFDIQSYEKKLTEFFDYARNQVHAHRLRNDDLGEKLIGKLKNQGMAYGILPVEIDTVIEAVLCQ